MQSQIILFPDLYGPSEKPTMQIRPLGTDCFTLNIGVENVAGLQVHYQSLNDILDLGYEIVNACRKLQGDDGAAVAKRVMPPFESGELIIGQTGGTGM